MCCSCSTPKPFVANEENSFITDTFGPFHDETILSGIDKVLYFLGTPKISPSLLNIGDTILRLIGSSGIEEIAKNLSSKSMGQIETLIQEFVFEGAATGKKDSKCNKCSQGGSVRFNDTPQYHLCPKCGGKPLLKSPGNTSKLAKKDDLPDRNGQNSKNNSFNRSFSLCSLACRNVKENLLNFQKKNSEWICKKKRNAGKHQVFEIFRNTKQTTSSRNAKQNESPNMILIVTPCGKVFPFQTVSTHF